MEEHDGDETVVAQAVEEAVAEGDGLSDRQRWILDQVQAGAKLTRPMVEQQFGIGQKQAKRELAALTAAGKIAFRRRPRPGWYESAASAS